LPSHLIPHTDHSPLDGFSRKFPRRIKTNKAIKKIREDPLFGKPLTGVKELRRIKTGNYRVIYTFRKDERLLLVVKIGQRKDVYSDLKKLKFNFSSAHKKE
jgi:mRNA-degrading endonuclease RelE of RelBE toxin-antitoxin system